MPLNKLSSAVCEQSSHMELDLRRRWMTDTELNPFSKANTSLKRKKIKLIKKKKRKHKNFKNSKCTKLKIKAVITNFLQNSSVYILRRFGNSRTNTSRFFWITLFIISSFGCLSQVALFLNYYYKYPVVVDVETNDADFLEFPAVTVCNVNKIKKEYEPCVEMNLDYEECTNVNQTQKSNIFYRKNIPLYKNGKYFSKLNATSQSFLHSYLSLNWMSRYEYGHTREDFLGFCSYNGQMCAAYIFEAWSNEVYGNCYTFPSGALNLTSKNPGPLSGLTLELHLGVEKYGKFTEKAGAVVEVHDPHSDQNIVQKGIFIEHGFETNIAVTKSIQSRLPPPFKDKCKYYEKGKSHLTCKDDCIQRTTIDLCSCITKFTRNTYNLSLPCDLTNSQVNHCVLKSERKADEVCKCPLSCKEIIYHTRVSSSLWPAPERYKNYKSLYIEPYSSSHPLSYEDYRETTLRLRIFYQTFEYTIYKQKPLYQSSEIFSQVGGLMGFWLGMSLVVVVDFVVCGLKHARKKLRNSLYLNRNQLIQNSQHSCIE